MEAMIGTDGVLEIAVHLYQLKLLFSIIGTIRKILQLT